MGVAAQDFELPALRGDYVKLSDYRGKVVFLNIWATWCPPCREEMPSMESLYQRLKGREFEMLAVSIDREGEKVVSPFAAKYGLTFPVLLDPDSKTYRLYGLTGVPESFIVDKSGVVIYKIIGPQNWMKKGVARLLRSHHWVTMTRMIVAAALNSLFSGKKQAEDFSPVILSESWSKN